jgi:hypothetical protein
MTLIIRSLTRGMLWVSGELGDSARANGKEEVNGQ